MNYFLLNRIFLSTWHIHSFLNIIPDVKVFAKAISFIQYINLIARHILYIIIYLLALLLNNSVQFFIYLPAYSRAQRPILKQVLAK
jgi:hypothetical protein